MIDTNVNLSRWPFRRLAFDETPALVAALKKHGVTQAWAGSFDALLHKDIAGVNLRLAEECRRFGEGILVPFGSVHPKLPDWEEDLRRCHEVHRMPGIRLHPNYHGYTLEDPDFQKLARLATERGRVVQIALKMEDERTQHPLIQVPPVDAAPLVKLLKELPGLRVVILNGMRILAGDPLKQLAAAGKVGIEISMLEGAAGISKLIDLIGVEKILFGSNFPYFNFESARLKLRESELTAEQVEAIVTGNARRLLSSQ